MLILLSDKNNSIRFRTEQYVTANINAITITEAQFEYISEGLRWDCVNGGFADGASYIYVIKNGGQKVEYRRQGFGPRYSWVTVRPGSTGGTNTN